jgi:hypothetical protein
MKTPGIPPVMTITRTVPSRAPAVIASNISLEPAPVIVPIGGLA